MKTQILFRFLLICCGLFARPLTGATQGRVVINEFLPWSNNTCAVNGEFIELMNFGPGPMNIGCYTVTNGTYTITIPPNTILQPGAYFVLAGSNNLPLGCGNVDSAIQVQLNWTTCGCTNIPVPTSGDGIFADGGSANEKVVLLNASMQVVDAVTRQSPPSAAAPMTTSNLGGLCTSRSFDLDTMNIRYEVLGMSTGRANSFARTIDGDCVWVKDPPQSAHATNNRDGDVSAVQYDLHITGARDCGSGGSINIQVNILDATVTDYNRMFPMNYAIAYDANRNGLFELNDTYTYGADSTPPSIDITGLPLGTYRIVVGSVLGCFLATFNLSVLPCTDPLAAQIVRFNWGRQTSQGQEIRWSIAEPGLADELVLEKSADGRQFFPHLKYSPGGGTTAHFNRLLQPEAGIVYYRLRLQQQNGRLTYSQVLQMPGAKQGPLVWLGPNPAANELKLRYPAAAGERLVYRIFNSANIPLQQGAIFLQKGLHTYPIPVGALPAGVYHLQLLETDKAHQPNNLRFVKQ